MATPPPPQQGAGPHAHPYPQQSAGRHTGPYPQQGTGPQAGPYAPYAGPPLPAHAPQAPFTSYAPVTPEQGAYGCRLCGALPVADTTVHGHQGMVVLMRFLSRKGPFCRDCGLAVLRDMTARTLWQGWWGPLSLFVTPVTLLTNLGPWSRLRRLGPPVGGAVPALDPGRPLWRRPAALAVLVPLLAVTLAVPVLILVAVLGGGDPSRLSVGQCVRNAGDWSEQDLRVTGCGSVSAEYEVTGLLGTPGATCAPGEYIGDPKYSEDGWTAACLRALR
ncbi:hypothetical protein AMK16_22715 [Streptomyces sp. CB00455]|uniref:LppU/SCO3897 family protein n=1 Tax=Streptomyces sp. CB00455 TaxID=1703927 RepID=UPI00093B3795|nr:hypothetical protein [Streptomyces sp. CB00455]OKK17604.1 hypothetical protein AMK16_22715 [Streptomyces sp. CB00455]